MARADLRHVFAAGRSLKGISPGLPFEMVSEQGIEAARLEGCNCEEPVPEYVSSGLKCG